MSSQAARLIHEALNHYCRTNDFPVRIVVPLAMYAEFVADVEQSRRAVEVWGIPVVCGDVTGIEFLDYARSQALGSTTGDVIAA